MVTVYGLARVLSLHPNEGHPGELVRLIGTHVQQFRDLLGDLELVAHIERGRFEPILAKANAFDVARAAAAEPSEIRIAVRGDGAATLVPLDHASKALARLAEYAARLGGREEIDLTVRGTVLELSPVTRYAGRVLLDEERRPFDVATAVVLITAIDGSLRVDGERLITDLPPPSVGG